MKTNKHYFPLMPAAMSEPKKSRITEMMMPTILRALLSAVFALVRPMMPKTIPKMPEEQMPKTMERMPKIWAVRSGMMIGVSAGSKGSSLFPSKGEPQCEQNLSFGSTR